jgi:hypothetical protein
MAQRQLLSPEAQAKLSINGNKRRYDAKLRAEDVDVKSPSTYAAAKPAFVKMLASFPQFDLSARNTGEWLFSIFDGAVMRATVQHYYLHELGSDRFDDSVLLSERDAAEMLLMRLRIWLHSSRANPDRASSLTSILSRIYESDEKPRLSRSKFEHLNLHVRTPPGLFGTRISDNLCRWVVNLNGCLLCTDEKKPRWSGSCPSGLLRKVRGQVVLWIEQTCVQCPGAEGGYFVDISPVYHQHQAATPFVTFERLHLRLLGKNAGGFVFDSAYAIFAVLMFLISLNYLVIASTNKQWWDLLYAPLRKAIVDAGQERVAAVPENFVKALAWDIETGNDASVVAADDTIDSLAVKEQALHTMLREIAAKREQLSATQAIPESYGAASELAPVDTEERQEGEAVVDNGAGVLTEFVPDEDATDPHELVPTLRALHGNPNMRVASVSLTTNEARAAATSPSVVDPASSASASAPPSMSESASDREGSVAGESRSDPGASASLSERESPLPSVDFVAGIYAPPDSNSKTAPPRVVISNGFTLRDDVGHENEKKQSTCNSTYSALYGLGSDSTNACHYRCRSEMRHPGSAPCFLSNTCEEMATLSGLHYWQSRGMFTCSDASEYPPEFLKYLRNTIVSATDMLETSFSDEKILPAARTDEANICPCAACSHVPRENLIAFLDQANALDREKAAREHKKAEALRQAAAKRQDSAARRAEASDAKAANKEQRARRTEENKKKREEQQQRGRERKLLAARNKQLKNAEKSHRAAYQAIREQNGRASVCFGCVKVLPDAEVLGCDHCNKWWGTTCSCLSDREARTAAKSDSWSCPTCEDREWFLREPDAGT